jgi:hypothetical protein
MGDEGVAFATRDGEQSTTRTGREVLAAAAGAADPALAARIAAERDWRGRYLVHVKALVEAGTRSADAERRIAAAGLDAVHRAFAFRTPDGAELPLAEALRLEAAPARAGGRFTRRAAAGGSEGAVAVATDAPAAGTGPGTALLRGEGPRERELVVPYRGEQLRGDALRAQLRRWVDEGTAEPSFAEAIELVLAHPEWLDLDGTHVLLLGAGAELAPLDRLLAWGADVLAVDVPVAAVQDRIRATALAGAGTVGLPVRADGTTGADLVAELPAVRAWLDTHDRPLVVAGYAYAHGAGHTRVAVAADALEADLVAAGRVRMLAHLATPTDAFAVPPEVVDDARRRQVGGRAARAMRDALRTGTGGRLFARAYTEELTGEDGRRLGIADCLIPQQGPNYALAKRVQLWRATAARAAGVRVSANVAPAARTKSVVSNRVLAAAYAGAHHFGVEVFDPPTSRALMAALLVHDLHNPHAAADPATPLPHPLDHLAQAALHGGLWRQPLEPRSALGVAAVLGAPRTLLRR